MNSFAIFIKERFNPFAYIPMIISFLVAHYALASLMGLRMDFSGVSYALITLGAIAFFFRLRIYDEIKDYAVDIKLHPKRPLPRGIVTKSQLLTWVYVCAFITFICFVGFGFAPAVGILIALGYSWLMYKEFFISVFLRSHMTIYAVTHTFVAILLSLAIYSAISNQYVWQFDASIYYFALSNWLLFNIFEFGRKSHSTSEEKPKIDSYSKIYGRYGAVALVIFMGTLSLLLLNLTPFADLGYFLPITVITLSGLSLLGLMYSVLDSRVLAHSYRIATSMYLVCIYAILIILTIAIG